MTKYYLFCALPVVVVVVVVVVAKQLQLQLQLQLAGHMNIWFYYILCANFALTHKLCYLDFLALLPAKQGSSCFAEAHKGRVYFCVFFIFDLIGLVVYVLDASCFAGSCSCSCFATTTTTTTTTTDGLPAKQPLPVRHGLLPCPASLEAGKQGSREAAASSEAGQGHG